MLRQYSRLSVLIGSIYFNGMITKVNNFALKCEQKWTKMQK